MKKTVQSAELEHAKIKITELNGENTNLKETIKELESKVCSCFSQFIHSFIHSFIHLLINYAIKVTRSPHIGHRSRIKQTKKIVMYISLLNFNDILILFLIKLMIFSF